MNIQRLSSASPFEKSCGFCRALRVGNRIEIAGTAPIGDDGKTVGIGDPAAQARRCFDIVGRSLQHFGASYRHVIRTRMFVTDIAHWETIGRVHGEYFGQAMPVATMVGVATLIDPDWFIEVEAEALVEELDYA